MENTRIKIGGMSCQGCVKNIQGILLDLPGVRQVEISLEDAVGCIEFDRAAVTRDQMITAIEEAGFDAT